MENTHLVSIKRKANYCDRWFRWMMVSHMSEEELGELHANEIGLGHPIDVMEIWTRFSNYRGKESFFEKNAPESFKSSERAAFDLRTQDPEKHIRSLIWRREQSLSPEAWASTDQYWLEIFHHVDKQIKSDGIVCRFSDSLPQRPSEGKRLV